MRDIIDMKLWRSEFSVSSWNHTDITAKGKPKASCSTYKRWQQEMLHILTYCHNNYSFTCSLLKTLTSGTEYNLASATLSYQFDHWIRQRIHPTSISSSWHGCRCVSWQNSCCHGRHLLGLNQHHSKLIKVLKWITKIPTALQTHIHSN